MQPGTKKITALVLMSAAIVAGILWGTSSSRLQSSVLYQYGYSPPMSADRSGTFSQSPPLLSIKVVASGSQVSPLVNVPTSYIVSVQNTGTGPVNIYGAEFALTLSDLPQLFSPPVADPFLVHTYKSFDYEASELVQATSVIRYAGSNVTGPKEIAPGEEIFLFSFMGTYTTPGEKNIEITFGRLYFSPLRILSPTFEEEAEFNLTNTPFTFYVRSAEVDLSGPQNVPDGKVDMNDTFQVLKNWSEE